MNLSNSLLLASIIASMCVGIQCAKNPDCPWPIDLYVWAYMFFALCGFVCESYVKRESSTYLTVYIIGMLPATTAALGLSMYALNKSGMRSLMVMEFILFVGLAYQVGQKYHSWRFWQDKLVFYVAVCFTVSGLFLLLSLDKLAGTMWDETRLVLGGFLLAFGILHWILTERYRHEYETTRSILKTQTMTHWVPAFLAIAAFCVLGWFFSNAKVTP